MSAREDHPGLADLAQQVASTPSVPDPAADPIAELIARALDVERRLRVHADDEEFAQDGDVPREGADVIKTMANALQAAVDVDEFEVSCSGEFAVWSSVLDAALTRAVKGD